MRYEVLGDLRVADESNYAYISARKVAILLALLVIRRGGFVSVSQIIDEIWEDRPPAKANGALHVYVCQLRKFLKNLSTTDSQVLTRSSGYLLHLGKDELDLQIFQDLIQQGREQMQDRRFREAAQSFDDALALWRGPALTDLEGGPIIRAFAAWVDEIRLECVELRIEAGFALGRHREHVGQLYALTSEHPLREVFYRQLMLALYHSDLQADALRVYQSARDTLRQELGLDPCRRLRDLHRSILTSDIRLRLPAAS